MKTCHTMVQVHGISWVAKIQTHTHAHDTHDPKPAGFPTPVTNLIYIKCFSSMPSNSAGPNIPPPHLLYLTNHLHHQPLLILINPSLPLAAQNYHPSHTMSAISLRTHHGTSQIHLMSHGCVSMQKVEQEPSPCQVTA